MTSPSAQQPLPEQEQEQEYPAALPRWTPGRAMRCAATKDGACWRERALVTGGDPGIGAAVAVAFAQEGADVAIAYLSERERHAG
jgi:hypothetical protein